ncbi:gamma-glutamyltransferase [Deinococcus arenicola]|uniref:Glutathione hydrolase proenzyme n=1 Tax=Deinococcus arenicola TaxID=2994950 RepID=A0ABU4DMR7_9DEIO|nr:gamma-glutamyltransferase [Deinococcus sp. ZS9-10]MDV6373726.1 gamma-glutamyltransferase [Deinococcus sp. ZS9-10]
MKHTLKRGMLLLGAALMLGQGSVGWAQMGSGGAKVPTASGTGGAVATVDHDASLAAMKILEAGGNAVDAAVAAAATLGLTEPFSCGVGGGGFMVVYLAKEKRVITIDHREMAPASFTPSVFLEGGKPIDFNERVTSGLSAGVPGVVMGWQEALQRYGTKTFAEVLAPAIALARGGYVVDEYFQSQVKDNQDRFKTFTSTAALYLPGGNLPAVGSKLNNPDMARAYEAIAAGGAKAFYTGAIAQAMVNTVNTPPVVAGSTANVRKGNWTLADVANYEARIRQPTASTYRGYTIYGMQPPSSGGLTVGETLNILEGYDMGKLSEAEAYHRYIEASRLAFADRNAYMADPEYTDVPQTGLLSKEFAAERRKLITDKAGTGPVGPGNPFKFQTDPSMPLLPAAASLEGNDTTHLTVSDAEGNVVSYTFTIESIGGNGMVVPGYGFLLNNELTDFDAVAPHPNVPEAGKRPRSSMTPTIVLRDGKPVLALGSPGGSTIITTVGQALMNILDRGLSPRAAIDAPRYSQRNGATTTVDQGGEKLDLAKALEAVGHKWSTTDANGKLEIIQFGADGKVTAAAESKRGGGGSALVQKP